MDTNTINAVLDWLRPYLYYHDKQAETEDGDPIEGGEIIKVETRRLMEGDRTLEWFLVDEETGDEITDISYFTPSGEQVHDNSRLYAKASELWGWRSQALQAVEEMLECSVALLHSMRKSKDRMETLDDIHEEFTHVEICMEQIRWLYDLDNACLDKYRTEALSHLESLIKEDEERMLNGNV